jgi:hypothetical protein
MYLQVIGCGDGAAEEDTTMFEGGREYKFNKVSGNVERVETATDRRVRESIKRADDKLAQRPHVDPFAEFVGSDLPH